MKYGVIVAEQSQKFNLGDDIWAYATLKCLPRVDYLIQRTEINVFRGKPGEKVAAIVGNFLFPKYNEHRFFPSSCIVPFITSFHARITSEKWISDHVVEYLKKNEPIGVRDTWTKKLLEKNGIKCFFSGCITLTLKSPPKRKEYPNYFCLVDLDADIVEKIKRNLKEYDETLDVRIMTHTYNNVGMTWEERMCKVEQYLEIYANARFVITSRLHVTLPCLVFNVPVLAVFNNFSINDALGSRIIPYTEGIINWMYREDLLGMTDNIFNKFPINPMRYHLLRKEMINSIDAFITDCENGKYDNYGNVQTQNLEWLVRKYGDIIFEQNKMIEKLQKRRADN